MAEQSFNLNFKGYWHEANIVSIPPEGGLYCVYSCTYNKDNDTVAVNKLIYIGEADDVNQRISKHEKWQAWKSHLNSGEEVCFSTAHVDSTSRERIEAALIFKHKPPVNDDYKYSFPFDRTTILVSGVSALLVQIFTVNRT